jgi:hypothetical protein
MEIEADYSFALDRESYACDSNGWRKGPRDKHVPRLQRESSSAESEFVKANLFLQLGLGHFRGF